jgi:hypothetical protein
LDVDLLGGRGIGESIGRGKVVLTVFFFVTLGDFDCTGLGFICLSDAGDFGTDLGRLALVFDGDVVGFKSG